MMTSKSKREELGKRRVAFKGKYVRGIIVFLTTGINLLLSDWHFLFSAQDNWHDVPTLLSQKKARAYLLLLYLKHDKSRESWELKATNCSFCPVTSLLSLPLASFHLWKDEQPTIPSMGKLNPKTMMSTLQLQNSIFTLKARWLQKFSIMLKNLIQGIVLSGFKYWAP